MNKYIKILSSIYFRLIIFIKSVFSNKVYNIGASNYFENLFDKFSEVNKIVVLCNGPSANLFNPSKDCLYLVTNSGRKLVENYNFLYYVNDPYYVQLLLANEICLDVEQEIIFYYSDTQLHKQNLNYLINHLRIVDYKNLFFISQLVDNKASHSNFKKFINFYEERGLPVKVQNSGMFLMLFGYYLAFSLDKPLEIYGLDMGHGGSVHFDGKGIIGGSVIEGRVKKNVKRYLDFIYKEYGGRVVNHSFFNPN